MSFETILPFLRPIERFILDEDISEIMVNPSGAVFIERSGEMELATGAFVDKRHLEVAVKNIARRLGDDISEEKPILDSRLPDGSRVAAVFSPCSLGGVTLTVRKFRKHWYTLHQLVDLGSVQLSLATRLEEAVAARKNVLVSGGTGTGKTTLLNALASLIPDSERVIVVEETAEIQLARPNVIRWESRSSGGGLPAVTIRDLVKASLRHRPDRLIVGEVRGGEAFDLLQALNTGHAGSVSTIHANSPLHALNRLTNCVIEAGVELPYEAILRNIEMCIDVVVQLERRATARVVAEVIDLPEHGKLSDKFLEMAGPMSERPRKQPTRLELPRRERSSLGGS